MHIYIHIPFCRTFCTYCSFYSVKNLKSREAYLKALLHEAATNKDFFKPDIEECHTIYIGGGTPSCLSGEQIYTLISEIRNIFPAEYNEITVEANPNDINKHFVENLVAAGVNRVSLGVQSFIDSHLKWMNRRHSASEASNAVQIIRENGIQNISLDLIFGYSLLTDNQWIYNLKTITDLCPSHISAYQLSIDSGSVLEKIYKKGEYTLLPDEQCAKQYSILQEYLNDNGYNQYEISNFSLGLENRSKHNSSYWKQKAYLGLGPVSHSFKDKYRYWNKPILSKYLNYYESPRTFVSENQKINELKNKGIMDYEILTPKDIFNETIMLGLRTSDGINISKLSKEFPEYYYYIEPLINKMLDNGELDKITSNKDLSGNIRIKKENLFIADNIIRELFII